MRRVLYILGSLEETDIEWLVEAGEKLELSPEKTVVSEGNPLEHLYIVVDGNLKVTIGGEEKKEIAKLSKGEIIGEVSMLDSRPPMASIITTSDTILLAISRMDLNRKLEEDFGFAARFYKALGIFLAQRLRNTVGQLGYGNAEEEDTLSAETETMDELDPELLEKVALAGRRFDYILNQLMNR